MDKKETNFVHVGLPIELKTAAEITCKEMGISLSDAVRIFLKEVVLTRKIPFKVNFSADVPNLETLSAIKEIESGQAEEVSIAELRKIWKKDA